MTAERVFKLYRAYKFFYDGKFDFAKYRGNLTCPPLDQQRDRQYYHRLANKLTDTAIHAMFTYGFFFKPQAHVSEFVSPEQLTEALVLSGRAENGHPLLQADIYTIHKRLPADKLDDWLYGAIGKTGLRDWMPGCLSDVIGKRMPLDLACMVLLIPQEDRHYDWTTYWEHHPAATMPLGPFPWIDRLKKLDQLFNVQRPAWRHTSHHFAKTFWSAYTGSLAPQVLQQEVSLF